MNKKTLYSKFLAVIILSITLIFIACEKNKNGFSAPYDTKNSVTLFNPNDVKANLTASDTVLSKSGLNTKFIPVSGAIGATNGLQSIKIELRLASNDSLINSKTITSFFRPDYHVLNDEPIEIPKDFRGRLYRVSITATDQSSAEIGKESFLGLDVLTCSPQASCIVPNQVTLLVETPATTPPDEDIYIFGGFNGWNNTDQTYKLTKNPDVVNCYCISLPFKPGEEAWQIGEVFFTRGSWGTNATTADNSGTFIENYNATAKEALWKVKVPRWRDK